MTTMNDLERKAVLSGKGVSELKGNVNGTTDKNVQSMKDKVASLLCFLFVVVNLIVEECFV